MATAVEQLSAMAGALGLSGVLAIFVDRRMKRREKACADAEAEPAAQVSANAKVVTAYADASAALFKDYQDQLAYIRGRCDGLEAGQAGLEAKVEACETHRAECEERLVKMSAEIDRLMQTEVPSYQVDDLKRGKP